MQQVCRNRFDANSQDHVVFWRSRAYADRCLELCAAIFGARVAVQVDNPVEQPNLEARKATKETRPRRRSLFVGFGGLMLAMLSGGLIAWWFMRSTAVPPVMRFAIDLPRAAPLAAGANPLAFSRDGTYLAYVAQQGDGTQLYLRRMDSVDPRPIPGTQGASSPFFSPDNSWIGYFDTRDSKLKKVALGGGDPIALCPAQFALGASWNIDGSILFTPDVFSGLWRVPAAGGKAEPVTHLQPREFTHRWPQVLADGKTVILTIGTAGAVNSTCVAAITLKTGQRKVILDGASDGRYSPTGHLLFLRAGNLMAVRFDARRLRVLGEPFLVKQGIGSDQSVGSGHYALSGAGALAYAPAGENDDLRSLAWADRQGRLERLTVNRGAFSYPRLSPDGRQLAVVVDSQTERSNIWAVETTSGIFRRLTFDGDNLLPTWTPDGKRLTFASNRDGQWQLYWMQADTTGSPELLHKSENPAVPNSWSSDGKSLVFTEFAPDTGPDIWILSNDGAISARPYLQTPYAEWGGTFSPDGHWLAYVSNDSGLDQVYVQPFPGNGERFQISTADGREPVWQHGGSGLFYRCWRGLMEVGIHPSQEFAAETPRLVVPGEYETGSIPVFPNFDAAPDGQRFVLIPREQKDRRQINIDLNWLK